MALTHLLDWSGGMQNRTSRFLARQNEFDVLVNGHTDQVGAVEKRPGFKQVGTAALQASKSILGVNSGGKYLYAGVNDSGDTTTQIFYNDSATAPAGGTWTAVTEAGTVPASAYPVFLGFPELRSGTGNSMGAVIIAGAKSGALTLETEFIPTQLAYYGAPGTGAAISLAPPSRWMVRFRDRIYHGYCARNTGWTSAGWYNETSGTPVKVKANRIIFSNAPSGGAITYEDQGVSGYANFLDVDADNTGVGVVADQFVAFTASSMWIRRGTTSITWKKEYPIGCDTGWSVVNADVYLMWFNRNGIWAYSGGRPQKISNKIQPIIDGVSSPSAVLGNCHDDDHVRFYVGTLTIRGRSFSNCVIQYTLSTNSWTVYSYTLPSSGTITSFGAFNDGTNVRLYFGGSNGKVYVMSEVDDATVIYSDGDQTGEKFPISFWARTQKMDFGQPAELKDMNTLVVYSESAQGTNVNMIGDTVMTDGNPLPCGQLHKEIEQLPVNPKTAYWHQVEFTESSMNPSLRINGFTVDVRQKSSFLERK